MFVSTIAGATVPLAAPSDVDLHVAYCLGTEEIFLITQRGKIASTNPSTNGLYKQSAAAAQLRLDRLNSYLDVRLPLLREEKMTAASKQGYADAKFTLTDPAETACGRTCWQSLPDPRRLSLGLVESCLAKCDNRLPKIWSCKDLSWLP